MSAIIQPDTGKWLRMPISELRSAEKAGPLMVYRDHWWVVDPQGNALFYKSTCSPQCNVNKSIVQRVMMGHDHGGDDVVFLPWAYVQFNIGDYV